MGTRTITAVAVVLASACARPQTAPAVVPLAPYVGRLVTVSASIGGETVKLLLDTGAGQSLVTPAMARRLGCAPAGRGVSHRMTGERVVFAYCPGTTLTLGDRAIQLDSLAVWDLSAVLPPDLPPIDGVLGLDALAATPLTLDLAARELVLETPASLAERVRGMTRLTMRTSTGLSGRDLTVFLRGSVQGTGWFLLDSANLDLLLVAPHLVGGAAGGAPADVGQVPFTLDGLAPLPVEARAKDLVIDGAIPESFMRRFVWTMDLAASAVWVRAS